MADQAISPLRRRMIEDMTIRTFRAENPTTMCKGSISMFPFERIRDVDRPARQEQADLLRQLARYGGVSLDPRVRKLLGSSSKKAGPAGQSPRGSGERNRRGTPRLRRCE
jgi:hypothetical protein